MLNVYNILCDVVTEDISELIIKKLCISNMWEYISSKGINPNILFKLLKEHNCVISGSFPLLCLLNLPTENCDIDIYGQYNPDDDALGKKYHSGYPIHKFEELLCNIIPTTFDYINPIAECGEYSQIPDIRYTRSYLHDPIHSGKLLQFISVNLNPYKFIENTFDLSFCKMTFDGEVLVVPNFKDILHMKGKLEITVDKEILEMLKYTYDYPLLTSDRSEKLAYSPMLCALGIDIEVHTLGNILKDHLFYKYFIKIRDDKFVGRHSNIQVDTCDKNLLHIRIMEDDNNPVIALTALRIIKYKKRGFVIVFDS